ncbi:MAG: zinc ribbon domain-containing protein [Planctomycetota bacterium]
MPTYEYECSGCGHAFERFQSIKDKPIRTCPSCGRRKVSRLMGSGAGIIFKGSGFYETDYKRNGPKPAAAEGAPSPTAGGAGESKSGPAAAKKVGSADRTKKEPLPD